MSKALELAKRSKQLADEGALIHICSATEICDLLSADAAELRRLAEVNAGLLDALYLAEQWIIGVREMVPVKCEMTLRDIRAATAKAGGAA